MEVETTPSPAGTRSRSTSQSEKTDVNQETSTAKEEETEKMVVEEQHATPEKEITEKGDVEEGGKKKRKASEMEAAVDEESGVKEKKQKETEVEEAVEIKEKEAAKVAGDVEEKQAAEEETVVVKEKVDVVAEAGDVEEAKESKTSNDAKPATESTASVEAVEEVTPPKTAEKEAEVSQSLEDLPPKQTLGKGKRARIPNKRYSDIVISPRHNHATSETEKSPSSNKKSTVENGVPQEKETTNTGKSTTKTPKGSVDLTNPNFLKPFKHGWRRELVYRATYDNALKRSGDIYYYTPNGKKIRSMRELAENLKDKELTLDDFTFAKEPLGLDDPEKEIVREAKYKAGPGSTGSTEGKGAVLAKRGAAKAKGAAEASPAAGGKATAGKALKIKLPATRGQAKLAKQDKKSAKDDDMDVGTYQPTWQSPRRAGRWTNNDSGTNETDNKPCRPCSIRCQGVVGLVPTLQCRVCLCLYHNECVGMAPHLQIQHYECKNCQLEQDSNTAVSITPIVQSPPPLTPASLTTTLPNTNTTMTTTTPTLLPIVQNIPPITDDTDPKITHLNLQTQTESKGLVGGVTTWFPPSSTIQLGNNQLRPPQLGPIHSPRPQFVEILGDKKYLIIPKHNILSVSPSPSKSEENVKIVQKEPDAPNPASLGRSSEGREPNSPDFHGFPSEEVGSYLRFEVDKVISNDGNVKQQPTPVKAKRTSGRIANANVAAAAVSAPKVEPGRYYMENYLQHLAFGYNTLLYVFQYLKVQDLLRAGCVCQMWHDVASHPSLWHTVRMKNSQVHNFEGLASTLKKHNTVHLDLRKMLLPNGDEIWPSFSEAIKKVESLRKIELCRCPASVVEQLSVSNPDLEVVNAVTIKCETMSLAPFSGLKNLKELRLKSTAGLTLTSDLSALKELTELKHLSLTSIKDLHKLNIEVIAELKNLESLDLGECVDLPKSFGSDILAKLEKLEKLRLEKGQGNCYTFDILEAVKSMPCLEQLELVNFDVKNGFDLALGGCANIKKLLVIPTYISQSATTNHMVLGGVLRLRNTLSHFIWGVTLELLRVTELFIDQCEDPEKKDKKEKKSSNNGDSIPVLKPVPSIKDEDTEILPAHEPPQVQILPLQNLQKLLLQSLPTTRVKILKIPFHATWRQSITDTVN